MQNSVVRRRPFSLPSVRLGLEVLAFGVLVVLGMALVLAQTGQVASTGYQVERLEERKVYWQRENQGLEAEVARLRGAGARLRVRGGLRGGRAKAQLQGGRGAGDPPQ